MPTTYTPLRYPGGKTKIYPEIKAIMDTNGLIGSRYAEVFAGGAGLAIKLLLKKDVSSIVINDFDRAIYCMWNAIVYEPERLCEFVERVPLDVGTWLECRDVYRSRDKAGDFELAKAALYLNRTNVSGILGGGLIGGMEQTGPFKMDARFNRDTLRRKIEAIADRADDIEICCLDAEDFIDQKLDDDSTFAYFDPPYVQKGPGLYRDSFNEEKHRSLARKIKDCRCKWVVTYDADDLIGEIYNEYRQGNLDVSYSANLKTIGKEKIILGPGLVWPQLLECA